MSMIDLLSEQQRASAMAEAGCTERHCSLILNMPDRGTNYVTHHAHTYHEDGKFDACTTSELPVTDDRVAVLAWLQAEHTANLPAEPEPVDPPTREDWEVAVAEPPS
jgi:hypothetical protein